MGPSSAASEWRRHWTLVLAAAVGFSLTSVMTTSAGVFFGPLGKEFGWSRTELSLGYSLAMVLAILLNPFFGALIDKWGSRRIALPGIVLTACSVAAFSLNGGSAWQWTLSWIVWGTCSILVQTTVWSAAVAKAFSSGRGLALGLTMGGGAVGQIVCPPLANALISAVGWRLAYVYLGLGWGAVAFVMVLLFLVDIKRAAPTIAKPIVAVAGLSVREAFRNSALWRIAIATFFIMTIAVAITVHGVPILIETGATSAQAASIMALTGVAAIVGKLITGSLIDRFHGRWVGGITLFSTAIACPLIMAGAGSMPMVVIGILILGYAGGTIMQLSSYLTSRYGGLRNFGAIFGAMASSIAAAGSLGPLGGGIIHDVFGSYAPMLWIGSSLSLLSGALVFSLGRYPDWTTEPAAV